MLKESDMVRFWVSPKRTVCEVLREINDLAIQIHENGRMLSLILEALKMTKNMDRKLREYKQDWDKGLYGNNENYQEDIKTRGARQ